MAADAPLIASLRRMIAEPDADTYTDGDLAAVIERYPLPDAAGLEPVDPAWTPTYDLALAAADVWGEKAATLAADFDFAADGGDYKRSQAHEQAQGMARSYRAQRAARSIFVPAAMGAATEESET